ncbi:hypothetical protein [Shewanella algae]|uniref:hypothetical protein n=1 Tax=Shewanella algae TaxID=38313 RepID=UPI0034D57700
MSALGWIVIFGLTVLAYKVARSVVRILFDVFRGDAKRLKLSYTDANGNKVSKIVEIDDDLETLLSEIGRDKKNAKGSSAP